MLLSFFTPAHKATYLSEVYGSLCRQDSDIPWEWVIVPNGGLTIDAIPPEIRNDSRVVIVPTDKTGIGALKNFACSQCKGDVLVELDYDDWLVPNSFSELAKAYEQAPDGFYYSDFINLQNDGSCELYNRHFGWEAYACVIDGKSYKANRAFAPSARAICQIYYAPNHIRAWSRIAYDKAGGHDPEMAVGDDHDLVCRTYLVGAPFIHIAKPIYIYRRYDENSFVIHHEEIQRQQNDNCNKYLYPLIFEECRRNNKPMLDIGHADRCAENFESCDIGANNFERSALHTDDTVGCIYAHDVLQRIPQDRIIGVFNDMYRMLSPGGWLLTATPAVDDGEGNPGRGCFQDPSHRSYWSANNFWYFTNRNYSATLHGFIGRYQGVRCWHGYPSDWHKKHRIPYVCADLYAIKGQRVPGSIKI